MDFSVIFCRVGRLNGPTSEPNVVGLIEFHPLFTRRVSGFNWVGSAGGSDICTTLNKIVMIS